MNENILGELKDLIYNTAEDIKKYQSDTKFYIKEMSKKNQQKKTNKTDSESPPSNNDTLI